MNEDLISLRAENNVLVGAAVMAALIIWWHRRRLAQVHKLTALFA